MSFSELFRISKGKVNVSQTKSAIVSSGLAIGGQKRHDTGLAELVWENGQITEHGQSNRCRKLPSSSTSQPALPKAQDGNGKASNTLWPPIFGGGDSIFNKTCLPVGSCETELDQGYDSVPWFNYPIEEPEPLQNDYCSDILQELSAVASNDFGFLDNNCNVDQTTGNIDANFQCGSVTLHEGSILKEGSGPAKIDGVKTSEVCPAIELQRTLLGTKISEISSNKDSSSHNFVDGNSGGCTDVKLQRLEGGQTNCIPGFFNFSCFSRPTALVRAALENTNEPVGQSTESAERLAKVNQGSAVVAISNPPLSTLDNLNNVSLQNEASSHSQPTVALANPFSQFPRFKPANMPHAADLTRTKSPKEVTEHDKLLNIPCGPVDKVVADGEKTVEQVVAASSVCSGNIVERPSDDGKRTRNSMSPETGNSEGPSEEAEDESVGIRKVSAARLGAKRSRIAEVHNLSERRRRERINEKMRALQELIPNCNKTDKASLLDEAIEYLKMLQHQVQILSIGSGKFMPPVMFPTGMQHIAPMLPLSPMAVGMGMSMGYGMNMLDMSGGFMPMPPIQGIQLPVAGPTVLGSAGFHGVAGSGLAAVGHPCQGLPMTLPCLPLVQMPGGPPWRLAMGENVSRMMGSADSLHSAGLTSPKEQLQNIDSHVQSQLNKGQMSMNEARNEAVKQSVVSDQGHLIKMSEAPNPGTLDNAAPN